MSKSFSVFALMLCSCLPLIGGEFAVTAQYDAKYDMGMQPYAAGPNVSLEYSISQNLTGVLVASYHEWDKITGLSSLGYKMDRSYKSFSAMVGIKYSVYMSQTGLENYLLLLGGINRTNTIRDIVQMNSEDPTNFLFYKSEWDDNSPIGGVGFGLSFPVTDKAAFDVQTRHLLTTNSDNYNQLLIGIKYNFF